MQGENALWKELLVEKYGQKATDLLVRGRTWPRLASRWSMDLVNLEGGVTQDWFNTEVVRKVGNGTSTSFWRVLWRGEVSFMVKYPRLFSMANNQDTTVEEMCVDCSNGGGWGFSWRRDFFVLETNLLTIYWKIWKDLQGIKKMIGRLGSWRK